MRLRRTGPVAGRSLSRSRGCGTRRCSAGSCACTCRRGRPRGRGATPRIVRFFFAPLQPSRAPMLCWQGSACPQPSQTPMPRCPGPAHPQASRAPSLASRNIRHRFAGAAPPHPRARNPKRSRENATATCAAPRRNAGRAQRTLCEGARGRARCARTQGELFVVCS